MSTKTSMNLKVRWIFSGTSLINPWGFKDRFLDDFGLVDLRLGFSIFFGLENLADGRFFEVSDKVFLRWAVGLDLDIALFLFMAMAGFLLAMAGFFLAMGGPFWACGNFPEGKAERRPSWSSNTGIRS